MGAPELPYLRVARELAARLDAGEWSAGERMPSITDLAGQYGVSRATVVKSIKVLTGQGLVVTLTGYGTFRAGNKPAG
jgi:DNA-binding GntR family transcriptional regulator